MPRRARTKARSSLARGVACVLAALSLSVAPASGAAGEPGAPQPSAAQPGTAQPSAAQPSAAQPGTAQPSAAQPSTAQPSAAQPSAAQPSAAQPSAAQPSAGHKEQVLALYQVATQLLDAGRVAEACAVLEQGRTLDPTALNLLLRLGDCLARAGRTASAWNVFSEAAAIAKSAGDPRAARAAALAEALEPRLSRMEIAVPAAGAAPGLEIRRDGVLVLPAQWGQALPVDPGTHTIEARAPGRRRWSIARAVPPDGARVVVDVPPLEPEPPPRALATAPPAPRKQAAAVVSLAGQRGGERAGGGGTQRVLALATGGAGLVGLGLGAVFGAQAIARRDASNSGHCDAQNRCDAAGVALRADAQAAGHASTIAFSAGTAALLAAGVLFWTAPSSAVPARRAAAPTTASAAVGPGAFSLVVGGSY
ncbi:tetratricopeptide repeat protein [Sorangium sp. So ce513]|uniref:tetratricopeptide repeat protein n=1 Tax=Sorangium sp. So ce513 TaxID=3133315 RepID=UPI003F62141F